MMEQSLHELICLFNAAQHQAVEVLESKFGCSRPESQDDYISRCVPIIREANYFAGGFKIRPHGIGIEIKGNGLSIDFDFGENGQANGFDVYRLHNFVRQNKLKTPLSTEDEIGAAIIIAIEQGEVVKGNGMGSLHYVQNT